MAKYPSQVKNLSKWHQKKYFSHETGGGKGDLRRKHNKEGNAAYRANKFWDKKKEPDNVGEELVEAIKDDTAHWIGQHRKVV